MRLAGALPLAMLFASLPLVASGQQSNDPKKDEKPFLLASALRVSSMEKDLNKAAAEGYRLLGTWYSGQLVSILQKVNASPSASEYRCLDALDIPALEKKLKEAAAEGFRFVPRTLTQMSHLTGGTVG